MEAQHVQDLGGIYFADKDTAVVFLFKKGSDHEHSTHACSQFKGKLYNYITL